ncbi:hypothetical protein PoMZ_10303 [Pyricularia oryzae]|uniref:Uncharacterized protein n=1 Tax=Pyricularia oryzae TaxID=318829 RepID=A0A4P7MX39_PYROR|nr:hypothetical protein PoMZ_10303 [Pyricularia oryzae]
MGSEAIGPEGKKLPPLGINASKRPDGAVGAIRADQQPRKQLPAAREADDGPLGKVHVLCILAERNILDPRIVKHVNTAQLLEAPQQARREVEVLHHVGDGVAARRLCRPCPIEFYAGPRDAVPDLHLLVCLHALPIQA